MSGILGFRLLNGTLWYVYEIMAYYFFMYLALKLVWTCGKSVKTAGILVMLVNAASYFLFWAMRVQFIWYGTCIGISMGIAAALYRDAVESFINRYAKKLLWINGMLYCGISLIRRFLLHENHIAELLSGLGNAAGMLFLLAAGSLFVIGGCCLDFCGKISYEIYLMHMAVLGIVMGRMGASQTGISFLLVITGSVAAGYLLHMFTARWGVSRK